MLEQTETATTIPELITSLPASTETMDQNDPPKKPRGRKPGNGNAAKTAIAPSSHSNEAYFLVRPGKGNDAIPQIVLEDDGRLAAAQAIIDPDATLYRAVKIEPDEVFRGKK